MLCFLLAKKKELVILTSIKVIRAAEQLLQCCVDLKGIPCESGTILVTVIGKNINISH